MSTIGVGSSPPTTPPLRPQRENLTISPTKSNGAVSSRGRSSSTLSEYKSPPSRNTSRETVGTANDPLIIHTNRGRGRSDRSNRMRRSNGSDVPNESESDGNGGFGRSLSDNDSRLFHNRALYSTSGHRKFAGIPNNSAELKNTQNNEAYPLPFPQQPQKQKLNNNIGLNDNIGLNSNNGVKSNNALNSNNRLVSIDDKDSLPRQQVHSISDSTMQDQRSVIVWIFVGCCALLVVGSLVFAHHLRRQRKNYKEQERQKDPELTLSNNSPVPPLRLPPRSHRHKHRRRSVDEIMMHDLHSSPHHRRVPSVMSLNGSVASVLVPHSRTHPAQPNQMMKSSAMNTTNLADPELSGSLDDASSPAYRSTPAPYPHLMYSSPNFVPFVPHRSSRSRAAAAAYLPPVYLGPRASQNSAMTNGDLDEDSLAFARDAYLQAAAVYRDAYHNTQRRRSSEIQLSLPVHAEVPVTATRDDLSQSTSEGDMQSMALPPAAVDSHVRLEHPVL